MIVCTPWQEQPASGAISNQPHRVQEPHVARDDQDGCCRLRTVMAAYLHIRSAFCMAFTKRVRVAIACGE